MLLADINRKSIYSKTEFFKIKGSKIIKEVGAKIFDEKFNSFRNLKQKIVFVVFFILTLPINLIRKPSVGLDASWEISLNMLLQKKIVWGSDFVFTYGPLGFLHTRLAEYVTKTPIVLFTVFVWLNVLFIFFYFLRSANLKYHSDFFVALVVVFMYYYIVKIEICTTLMYIILFHLLYSIKYKNYFSLANAVFIGSLSVFIKLTYFFPLLIVFGLYYLFVFFTQCLNRRKVVFSSIFQILFLLFLSLILNVNITKYILGGYHIVSSYNDAMMSLPSHSSFFTSGLKFIIPWTNEISLSFIVMGLTFLVTIPILFIIGKSIFQKNANLLPLLTSVYCLFFLFLTFKYGFVRHGGRTYLHPPVLLYILALLIYFGNISHSGLRLYIYFICVVLFVPSFISINKYLMQRETFAYYPLVLQLKKSIGYSAGWGFKKEETKILTNEEEFVPERVLKKIGNNTVDVIPTEISIAFFKKLNYNPRPVIQSYAAYDSYLDNLNFDFYNSSKAPEFIIYNTGTIDNRYHFFDEPKTKFNLAKAYQILDSFNNRLLLQKRVKEKTINVLHQENTQIFLNKTVEIKNRSGYQLSSFKVKYTNCGAFIRFLFQPPVIHITFFLSNDSTITYRFIKTAVENPVLVNKFIPDNKAFCHLLNGEDSLLLTIRKIRIDAPKWAYEKEVEIQSKWILIEK